MYVRKYFPPEDKARIEAMVQNLIAAFDRRIDRLDWMAPKTKAMAKAKLKTLKVHVGYPDRFGTTPRSRSCAAMPTATTSAPSSSSTGATSPSSASRSIAASG
jgi:hypothetical protein